MAAETTPSKSMKTENSEKLVSQDSVNSVSRRDEWIKLNVGGTTFMTTRTTLSKDPKSFLFRLIQDEPDLNTDKVNIPGSIELPKSTEIPKSTNLQIHGSGSNIVNNKLICF